MSEVRSIITGTGSHIPKNDIPNSRFFINHFYQENGDDFESDSQEIVRKFESITGIHNRRYADTQQRSSDLATKAALAAIEDSGCSKEDIDYIILAHNFGDVIKHTIQTDVLPSLASRVKHNLKIKNPHCIPYDILFGCPGWIEGVIQAHSFIKSGMAKRCLVIGSEMLSRVLDPYDRDSMIFADGAGASIIEAETSEAPLGILSHGSLSHTEEEAYFLHMGKSNFPGADDRVRYIKMKGRKIYEYALTNVPMAMKECLDASGFGIDDVTKVFIHQANEKLDMGIIKRFFKLMGKKEVPEHIMPMSIHELGNSSVATVPTLLDLVRKGKMEEHQLKEGDLIILASVGAGMNINAITYKL
jgi:3-oxoacyl-[acyl-carrier-protein] synthase-3